MFVSRQAYQEVWIILREFKEKSAAIEHMEKNKRAALQILSQKDEEIKKLIQEVKELKKQLEDIKSEAKIDQNYYENARLRQRIEIEKLTHDKEMEVRKEEIIELKVRNSSLTQQKEEREVENAKLKDLAKDKETQLRSVAEKFENIKRLVIVERSVLNSKIDSVTAELEGLKREKVLCMKKVFDEKRHLEDSLVRKEYEIDQLKKEARDALGQADLLNSDIKKLQKNLAEHFQTILKARQINRCRGTMAPGVEETVKDLNEKALDSVVRSLVPNGEYYIGQRVLKINSEAESLHNYLSETIDR